MGEEQAILLAVWWDKLRPLRRKFVRETFLSGLENEDIEQECYLQLQKAIERYNPDRGVPFESYYKIMIYGWRANQNRHKSRREVILEEENLFFLQDERADVEKEVETRLLIEEVVEKIELLDEKERKIIKAYYFQHTKLMDIACELGLAYKTVEAKKQQALRKLRDMLGSDKP